MIKKLRVKFIAVVMAIVTLMMLLVFGFVLHNTRISMEKESMDALRQFAMEPQRPGQRPGEKPGRRMSMFALRYLPDGTLQVTGSTYFDLTDEQLLRAIYAAAREDGKKTGILPRWDLRYYRTDDPAEADYVFLDVSSQRQMLYDLWINCSLLFAAAVCVFFGISLLLSKWAIRPVEEAWERQRRFVADASHELKTPLTVILTNAELLQSEEYDAESKDRFSRSILTMSRQMRGLVEGLLELARLDGGKARAQFARVELSELVEDCVLGFEPVYFEEGRELRSSIEPGIRVRGSETHLRQVIDILLDNGRKYGTPGKPVELILRRQGRGKCLISVASSGQTLTAQQCKDIFKRFYRVDEARAMNQSYGLGLPIADSIVAEHRGRIWATGSDGVNVFHVALPTLS